MMRSSKCTRWASLSDHNTNAPMMPTSMFALSLKILIQWLKYHWDRSCKSFRPSLLWTWTYQKPSRCLTLMVMALWISRKQNRHTGHHGATPGTRDLDDPAGLGEVWSWLIVMDSEFLPSNLQGIGLSHGDDVGWFFSSGFLFCLFSQELLNSAHPHFEVQPNWSTSWHLSRRKALERDKWSMLIRPLTACLYMFYPGRVKYGNQNIAEHGTSLLGQSWRSYYKHLQFEIAISMFFFQRCIVLVCSGQLFSTSVITTADSARMSIQDATETSVLLENSVHCEFLYSSVLSVSSIHETWGFLGSLYHGVLCDKQCRPSKVVWLLGSRKQNHQDNQNFPCSRLTAWSLADALQPSRFPHGSVENSLKWSKMIKNHMALL